MIDDASRRTFRLAMLLCTAGVVCAGPAAATDVGAGDWPSFRGKDATGIAEGASPPVTWDVAQGRNVLWKTALPGLAHSSPVVSGDAVFVTTAVRVEEDEATLKVGLYGSGDPVEDEGAHRFSVMRVNRLDGTIEWTRTVAEGVPKVKRHPKASHASSTPATDGRYVAAFFGSEGLYVLDMAGAVIWKKDLGLLDAGAPGMRQYQWGFASSPVIHGDAVIVQCDIQDQSFLASFDLRTGKERWRTERDEDPTWCTPTVVPVGGTAQVLCNGYRRIGAYDLATGKPIWWTQGGGDVPVPTPVVAHGLVYLTSAHGRLSPITAIKLGATGEIARNAEDPFVVWSHDRRGNYMQTPLVVDDLLYCCHDSGILACYDAHTGEEKYRERLGGGRTGFSASAVAADGRIYVTSEEGTTHVIKAGPVFESLAVNELGETCMATPALSGRLMIFRGRHHLVAVEESRTGDSQPRDR